MTAQFGFIHKFDEHYTTKMKVNQEGHLCTAIKMKICNHLTATVNSGLQLSDLPAGKTKAHPFGFTFDIKL